MYDPAELLGQFKLFSRGDLWLSATARAGQVAAVIKAEVQLAWSVAELAVRCGNRFLYNWVCQLVQAADRLGPVQKVRATALPAVVKAAVEDAFTDLLGDRSVPGLCNRLPQQVTDRSFQPGWTTEKYTAVRMQLEPFKRPTADQLLFC